MKAIILSAGQGQRLKPITNDRPKGMVVVAGKPIIEHQIRQFRQAGIDDISIVDGYCRESIPDYGVRRYSNADFASTNMVYSLFCAESAFGTDPVIVSYGDILYSHSVLAALLLSTAPVSVVVDLQWKAYFGQRFNDPYEDAESLVLDGSGLIADIGRRDPGFEAVQAQYIGLIRFDQTGIAAIREIRRDVEPISQTIGWGRSWRHAYMTDLLQELIYRGIPVAPVAIHGKWCEIDSPRDFEIAEDRVASFDTEMVALPPVTPGA